LSMSLSVVITVFALIKETAPDGSQDTWDASSPLGMKVDSLHPERSRRVLAVIVGIGVPIAIAGLFLFLKLQTEVRPDGLYVRYLPFHLHFKRIAPEELSEYYARQYKPVREYGGWGIRCSFRNGKAYNVSGNKGVQLVFKNGKQLLIGSQKADELETAIRSIMGNR